MICRALTYLDNVRLYYALDCNAHSTRAQILPKVVHRDKKNTENRDKTSFRSNNDCILNFQQIMSSWYTIISHILTDGNN